MTQSPLRAERGRESEARAAAHAGSFGFACEAGSRCASSRASPMSASPTFIIELERTGGASHFNGVREDAESLGVTSSYFESISTELSLSSLK